MRKSLLVRLAVLLLTTSALSGCFWRVEEGGHRHGDAHEREHGDRHQEHHEDRGGYGGYGR